MIEDNFYRVFQDTFRGSRDLMTHRLKVYLPFVLPLLEIYEECRVIDLGCGRGEFLELLMNCGFHVLGVDLDENMIDECRKLDLPVEQGDALKALQNSPTESLALVTGIHIAEHLPFEKLLELVKESIRVLRPGGLLILETPNPENIDVFSTKFYLDPTHLKPLPPELLSFIPSFYGFERTKILRLQESPNIRNAQEISLSDVLKAVSPDYSVIAQKKANPDTMLFFDREFEIDFGITPDGLINRYESCLKSQFNKLETSLENMDVKYEQLIINVEKRNQKSLEEMKTHFSNIFEARIREMEAKAIQMEEAFNAIHNSRSWRITAPLRALGDNLRITRKALKNVIKPILIRLIVFIDSRPVMKSTIISLLQHFPKIDARLRKFSKAGSITGLPSAIDAKTDICLEETSFNTVSGKYDSAIDGDGLPIDEIIGRIKKELELNEKGK